MTNHCAKLHCFTCTCIYKQMLIKGTDVSFNYSILLSFNREPKGAIHLNFVDLG